MGWILLFILAGLTLFLGIERVIRRLGIENHSKDDGFRVYTNKAERWAKERREQSQRD